MKHILISCDSCNKIVPEKDTKTWWGHKKSGIQVVFAPLTKRNRSEFETGQVCSELCLAAVLRAYADTMDKKAEKVAAASVSYFPDYSSMFFAPGMADILKKKEDTDEDDD